MSPPLIFDETGPPTAWPSVSLCMIVKNEAENLAACIESVGDFVSEIIVVDTGSSDGSVELAQTLGAKVKNFAWKNDFAAARNESINEARGEWIFWLDADDRLDVANLNRLKHAVGSGKAEAYYCYVVSQLQDQNVGQDRIEHLRLFRNHLGVHFERPLHEDAAPVAHRLGLTIARTNIAIRHTGYAASREVMQKKIKRNLAIIKTELEREPDNLYWRFHLGVSLHVLGDLENSIEHLEAVIANPPPDLDRDSYLYQAYEGLMLAYVETGRPNEARRVLSQAVQKFSNRQHLWVRAGTVYLALDEPERAIEALERARTLALDTQGQSWAAGTIERYLYRAYLLLGQIPTARENYLGMLSKTGQDRQSVPAAIQVKAQALFEAGQYSRVIELMQPAAGRHPGALRLLTYAHVANRDWQEAAHCLAGAIVLSGAQPGEWADLAKYTLHANQGRAAARRFCQVALAEPSSGQDAAPLNLLGVVALAEEMPRQALAYFVQALLANPAYEPARNNLNQSCHSLNLAPAEVIQQYGLQLMRPPRPNYIQAAAAFGLSIELAPTARQAEAYKLMAVALQKMNKDEEALLCWQTAQQLATEN